MNKTKIFHFLLAFLLTLILVGCKKKTTNDNILITLNSDSISIGINEEYEINFTTNDEEGIEFSSNDINVVTVDNNGKVKGIGEGEAIITLKSKTDPTVTKEFNVTVITNLVVESLVLAYGMQHDIGYKVSDGYRFESSRDYVATVDDEGILLAKLQGLVEISIFEDNHLIKRIDLNIQNRVRTISLTGPKSMYFEENVKLSVSILPYDAYQETAFVIEDDSILTVDEEGIITPLKGGTTKVTIKSLQDNNTEAEITITVNPTIVVSSNTSDLKIGNYTFEVGLSLFNNINDAIAASSNNTRVLIKNYEVNSLTTINKEIYLHGDNATFKEGIIIDTNELVKLSNLKFESKGQIISSSNVNLEIDSIFANNIIEDTFIDLENIKNFSMINSSIKQVKLGEGDGIKLSNILSQSNVYLSDNEFEGLNNAVILENSAKFDNEAKIAIYYNTIKANTAFNITLDEENVATKANLYARFNQITDYNKAIKHNGPQVFEYTFNYFGIFDLSKFDNVAEHQLLGHYLNISDIMTKNVYNPEIPIIATLKNKPEQIELGDQFELEIVTLPYTADKSRYYIALDNTQIVDLIDNKILRPYRSGLLGVTIGSYLSLSQVIKHEIDLTTEPGMTFELSKQTAGLEIGDKFLVTATPFPYNLATEKVVYTSSDSSIATIDDLGNVEIIAVGNFEILASLLNDPSVEQRLPLTSYASLDENNLLDFYTMNQVTYSKVFDMTFHGTSIATGKLSESVTRILTDDIERFEDIIPVTPGFRPGTKFNSNIPEEFKYNEQNVVWIVVHDTGNSNVGAGARMHANYLMNQVLNNGRQASWHYTVDPTEIFQHMPLDEVAYHAGDGSALPGIGKESPALGGGNRNGISIEMSIQRDGDIFKTWQNTARLVAELLDNHNLPLTHQAYHYDFSGKECPQTLRRAGLVWLFEEYVANEYHLRKTFGASPNVQIVSKNPEILSNTGQIINIPNHSTIVEYDIIVMQNGVETTRTFRTLVEGLFR